MSRARSVLIVLFVLFLSLLPRSAAAAPESLADTVKGAEKIPGLLTFYRAPGKLWLEVPQGLLDTPLGLSVTLVDAVGDWLPRGNPFDNSVVTWRRAGDRLVLRKENLSFRAAPGSLLRPTVESSFPASPVFLADLLPLTDKPAPLVVDAGKLFGTDLAQLLPPNAGFSTTPEDATLVAVKSFPDNILARVSYRFRHSPERGQPEEGRGLRRAGPGRLADDRFFEAVVDYQIFRLPADDSDGYRPRVADERIGSFVLSYKDYTDIDRRDSAFRHLAIRWDVRPSDPAKPVSPAAEPITFYVDHGVPVEWRPLLKESAQWWNRAFEKVGIADAVRVLDRPDDPSWDPADLHHSMIYWNISDSLMFSGMAGPSVIDPRTGKVLKADVYLNGEFPSYTLHRYLVYSWWRAPEPGSRICNRQASFSSQIAFARLVLLSRGILKPGTPEAERFAREALPGAGRPRGRACPGLPSQLEGEPDRQPRSRRVGQAHRPRRHRHLRLVRHGLRPDLPRAQGGAAGRLLHERGRPLRRAGDRVPLPSVPGAFRRRREDAARHHRRPRRDEAGADLRRRRAERHRSHHQRRRFRRRSAGLRRVTAAHAARRGAAEAPRARARRGARLQPPPPGARLRRLLGRHGLHRHQRAARRRPDPAAPGGRLPGGGEGRSAADHPGRSGRPAPRPESPRRAGLRRRRLRPAAADPGAPQGRSPGGLELRLALCQRLQPGEPHRRPLRRGPGHPLAACPPRPGPRQRAAHRESPPHPAGALRPPGGHRLQRSQSGAKLSQDRRTLQRLLVTRLAKLSLTPEKGAPAEASQVAAATLRSIDARIRKTLPGTTDGYARAHLEDLRARIKRTLEAGTEVPAG